MASLKIRQIAALAACVPVLGVPSARSLSPPPAPDCLLREAPIPQNFFGAACLRHDMVSLSAMALTPYNGNFLNSSLVALSSPPAAAVPLEMQWLPFEGRRTGVAGDVTIENAVRLQFETSVVMQVWNFTSTSGSPLPVMRMNADGPYFRRCDVVGQAPCGWGTNFPIDRQNFAVSVAAPITSIASWTTTDTLTGVVTAAFLRCAPPTVCGLTVNLFNNSTLDINITMPEGATASTVQLAFAVSDNYTAAFALMNAIVPPNAFMSAWTDAEGMWEERWQQAFQRPAARGGSGTHFSGSLPVLSSNMPNIDTLYYWAALAMVSLERTQYPTGPRVFVISQGPSNSLSGVAGMGGSGQFSWDLSFASGAMSLLDPEATKQVLQYIISGSDLAPPAGSEMPVLVPQSWDAYEYAGQIPSSGTYRFDFLSVFLFLHSYVTLTNDTDFLLQTFPSLTHPGTNCTGVDYMRAITAAWSQFTPSTVSPWLADYGPDKRAFLEVVRTYIDVIPALQAGNVGMALALARLVEQLNVAKPGEPDALRTNASAIFKALLTYQWNDADNGVWRCLYPNGSYTAVRSVTDYVYVPLSLGLLGANASMQLPPNIAKASAAYFESELLGNGWVRALSLSDPLCANVMSPTPGIEDLMVCRPDWGCFGAYGGIPGFAVESVAHLTGSFSDMVAQLSELSRAAASTSPGQGIAVGTPTYYSLNFNGGLPMNATPVPPFTAGFPEFFDEPGFPPWWPESERFVQNAEASIVDVIVRTLFGWRPSWVTPSAVPYSPQAADVITRALFMPHASRAPFAGTLGGVWTALGYINITANASGLSWVWA